MGYVEPMIESISFDEFEEIFVSAKCGSEFCASKYS